jgi:hypothetical protein
MTVILLGAALLYAGSGDLIVDGNVTVDLNSTVVGNSTVSGNSAVAGNSTVSGILGVGTTNPAVTLDVSGSERVGNLGVGQTMPSTVCPLYLNNSFTDPGTTWQGMNITLKPTYATGATKYSYGGVFQTYPIVDSSITQGGCNLGLTASIARNDNGASAADNGTLSMLQGLQVTYGHWNANTSASPVTTSVYGLYMSPWYRTGTISNMYDIFLAAPSTGGTVTNKWGFYQAVSDPNHFAGNVTIGTTSLGSGGGAALLFGLGAKPSGLNDEAGLYAKDVSNVTELFAFDESGTEIQISAHAQDAPDSLYDLQDGLPMIAKEVQYFLGYVRYTNKTRMARLAGMTDAQKSALSASQTQCVITENFADHQARTGEQFTLLVWDQEQAAIKQNKDAQRQAALAAQASLTAAIAQTTQDLASATADQQKQLQTTLAVMQQQLNSLVVPDVYQVKPVPPRLQAALASGLW